jgi:hypothetical protein
MNENPGIEALRTLAKMGYRLTISRETIKGKFHRAGKPAPERVLPLLERVKANKREAIYFLKSCCPKCGGVCFIDNSCLACDWEILLEKYPDLSRKQ